MCRSESLVPRSCPGSRRVEMAGKGVSCRLGTVSCWMRAFRLCPLGPAGCTLLFVWKRAGKGRSLSHTGQQKSMALPRRLLTGRFWSSEKLGLLSGWRTVTLPSLPRRFTDFRSSGEQNPLPNLGKGEAQTLPGMGWGGRFFPACLPRFGDTSELFHAADPPQFGEHILYLATCR